MFVCTLAIFAGTSFMIDRKIVNQKHHTGIQNEH